MVEVICTQYFTFLSSVIIFAKILMIGGQIIAWVYPLAHQNSAIIPKPDKKPMARFKRPEANSPANIIFPGWRRSASIPLRN